MDSFCAPPSLLPSIPSNCAPDLDWTAVLDPASPSGAVVPPLREPETSTLVPRQPGTAAGAEDPFPPLADSLPALLLAAPEKMEARAAATAAQLLEGANRVAVRSKLELRRELKHDLSLHKGAYTLKERSIMRSRREAAVSRHNKLAYTRQLEVIVQRLVHECFILAAKPETGGVAGYADDT
jgi:hypothetical protein